MPKFKVPVPQNAIIFLEIGSVKMLLSSNDVIRVAVIQYDSSPYIKGKFGHKNTQSEDYVKILGESCLQAQECVLLPEARSEA